MNAIISLCHFCELHGPKVLFCTQPIHPEEKTGPDNDTESSQQQAPKVVSPTSASSEPQTPTASSGSNSLPNYKNDLCEVCTVNVLNSNTVCHTFLPKLYFFMLLFHKVWWECNSVDPDQTAPSRAVRSGSALFTYSILSDKLVYKFHGSIHQFCPCSYLCLFDP